jgi:bifunctional DNase/RNase
MRAVLAVTVVVLGLGVALVAAPMARRAVHGTAMTELHVRDVVPLQSVHQAAIILAPDKGDLIIPVLVSEDEGEQVADQLAGRTTQGGLLRQAISGLGGKLVRVELSAVKGETVVAQAVVERGGKSMMFEGTPADTIGLALEEHVPVLASKAVMDGLGLTKEQIRALANGHPGDHPGGSAGSHELQPTGSGNSISL